MTKQGDLALLNTPTAQQLLAAPVAAHLAYMANDEYPRNIPINFVWDGEELVMGTFAGTYKVTAMQANPHVSVCIDTDGAPPAVLMLRGKVTVTEVEGMLPEYAAAHRKTVGGEMSEGYLAAIDKPGLRMVRIGLRPTWAGMLDFQERIAERTPEVVLAALRG